MDERDWHKRPSTTELEAWAKANGQSIEVVCRLVSESGAVRRFEYARLERGTSFSFGHDWTYSVVTNGLFHSLGLSVAQAKWTIEKVTIHLTHQPGKLFSGFCSDCWQYAWLIVISGYNQVSGEQKHRTVEVVMRHRRGQYTCNLCGRISDRGFIQRCSGCSARPTTFGRLAERAERHWGLVLTRADRTNEGRRIGAWKSGFILSGMFPGVGYTHRRFGSLAAVSNALKAERER